MSDKHDDRRTPPAGVQPREIPREKRPTDDIDHDPRHDGELPGMPLSRDPLLNPGPTPD
jgi:hypothetical protein